MAPICGTPAASRTVPEIAALSEAAAVVVRDDNASTINSHPNLFVFIPTAYAVPSFADAGGRRRSSYFGPRFICFYSIPRKRPDLAANPYLLDDEFGRRGNRLLRNIIAYFDSQLVSSWSNVLYWQTLLQGDLVALGHVLHLMHDGLLVGGIHDVVLHYRR